MAHLETLQCLHSADVYVVLLLRTHPESSLCLQLADVAVLSL